MTDDDVWQAFNAIYKHFQNVEMIFQTKPLLAHYTSIQTVEKIIKNEEICFSNPLFMNYTEELQFGLHMGMRLFYQSKVVDEKIGNQAASYARQKLIEFFNYYDKEHVLDVYVFCLSEHDQVDNDGKLSMWRAYGSSGNGAAIVFNTTSVYRWEVSPKIFAKVEYASTDERQAKLEQLIGQLCGIVAKNKIHDNGFWLDLATAQLFDVFKMFALTWKHKGFSEEKEWRVIYMPERDKQGVLKIRSVTKLVTLV